MGLTCRKASAIVTRALSPCFGYRKASETRPKGDKTSYFRVAQVVPKLFVCGATAPFFIQNGKKITIGTKH